MNEKIFKACVSYFNRHSIAYSILEVIYKGLPNILFVAYPTFLLYVWFFNNESLPKLVFVPLGVFLLVTVLRVIINEQRPYEKYGTPSVFNKQTKGKSFPSRHTASAFIIAMAFLYINVPLGIVALLFSLLIEASRVLAGAHYAHDVIAGSLLSIVAGIIFIFLF